MIKLNKLAKKQRELDAEDVPKRKLHTIETRAIDDNGRMELEQALEKEINEYCMTNSINDVDTSANDYKMIFSWSMLVWRHLPGHQNLCIATYTIGS